MKFKAGDKVQYKGDDETYKIVKIAEQGEVVKGPWCDTEREFEVPEKAYIIEGSDGEWYYHEVEKEKYYELITEETPPKFKVGDTVGLRNEYESFKIIKIAEKGEIVDGPWWDEDENVEFKIPEKAYILEDEEKEWYYYEVSSEERLNLVTEETPPKFQVGDIIRHKEGETLKVIKIAEEGEEIRGPWWDKHNEEAITIPFKTYILEDKFEWWLCIGVEQEKYYELITEEHLKQQREEKLVEQLLGSRETTKRLEKELKDLEYTPKFNIGDIIRDRWGHTYKVLRMAEEGELIEGPWGCSKSYSEVQIPVPSYLIEDGERGWFYHSLSDEPNLDLVTEEELKDELSGKIEELVQKLKDDTQRLERLKEALIKRNYSEVLYKV